MNGSVPTGDAATAFLQGLLNQLSETQERGLARVSQSQNNFQEKPVEQVSIGLQDSPNPGKITTYKEAIRYIFKYMASNEDMIEKIRLCIREQARNEQEWWSSREQLVKQIQAKNEARSEIQGLMSMVTRNTNEQPTQDDQLKELNAFDIKVYRSMKEMTDSHQRILSSLNVPLFCVLPSVAANLSLAKKTALFADQKRLLGLLKDLCE